MIKKHLAYLDEPFQIDIHGGGKELLFPHHENEAIQTKHDSGQELSKYWMHNGFVTVSGEKMSKSLGNSFFLKDVLEHYHGEVLRFYLLSSHYRADIDFSETNLIASKKRLDRIYRLKRDLIDIVPAGPDAKFVDNMLEALNNDLNISEALVILDEMMLSTERKDVLVGNLEFVSDLLGIGASDPEHYFKFGLKMVEKIEELIKQRSIEKANKNFSAADRIRDELNAMGINVMDSKDGKVEWEVI